MRWHGLHLSLLVSSLLLLASGCGLAEKWREDKLRSYHQSRWQELARQQAFPESIHVLPTRPAAPKDCAQSLEPLYKQCFEAQQERNELWGKLLDACKDSDSLISEVTAALARRDGAEISQLTPRLSKTIKDNSEQLDAWRAAGAQADGAVQSLQLAWMKVWPTNDFEWDIRVEIERLREDLVAAQLSEQLAADADGKSPPPRGKAAEHAMQQARNQRLQEIIAYHDAAYGQLCARYLGRAAAQPQSADPVAVPKFAGVLHGRLQSFELSLAARYELDLAIEDELDRFEYVTGLSLEEVLELPAEDLWEPENEQARKEIEARASERKAAVKAGTGSSKGESGLPLSRRSVWLMLKEGRVPSLEGKKIKELKGQRKQTVEVTLARLQFYRQLDDLLTRNLNVQQREIATQWELLWPNPPVEADIFEYAQTLPEADTAVEAAPDTDSDKLP